MQAVMAWSFWRPGAIRCPPRVASTEKKLLLVLLSLRSLQGFQELCSQNRGQGPTHNYYLPHNFQFFDLHTHQSLKPESLSLLQWENVLTVSKSQSSCITRSQPLTSQGLVPTLFLVLFETLVSFSPLDRSYQHKTCSTFSQLKPTIQDKLFLHSLTPSRATFPDFSLQQKFTHLQVPFTRK